MKPLVALSLATAEATFMLAVFYVVLIRVRSHHLGRRVRFRPWPNRHPRWRGTLFQWLQNPRCRLVFDQKIEVSSANRHLRRHFQRRRVPVPDDLLEELNYWDDAEAMWYLLDWLRGVEEQVVDNQDQLRALMSEDEDERLARVLSWYVPADAGPSPPGERTRSRPILRHAPPALAVPIREAVAA